MKWEIYYYNDKLPLLKYSSDNYDYIDLPKYNVAFIIIFYNESSHKLLGYDYYWINENSKSYGMYNEIGKQALIEENKRKLNMHQEIEYTGHQSVSFTWINNKHTFSSIKFLDKSINILKGVMLPDEDAKKLKLI